MAACRKTTITVPPDLLAALDRGARKRGESRSKYIVRILREAMKARRGAEVTRRLNKLFTDEKLAAQDLREANEWDKVGSDWTDESW